MTLASMLFLLLVSVAPASAAMVRQPYLQLVTPTSITIVWRTDLNSADNSRVQYGTVFGTLNQSATGTAVTRPGLNVKDHIVTIAGLNAATKYFYNVGTTTDGVQGGGTNQHYFVTAPTIGSSTPVRAWVLGDSGDAGVDQSLVRDAMLTETAANPPAPTIILHMGDIAYESGTDSEFTSRHFAVYQDILRQTSLWPTLGNHEALSVTTSLGIGPYYEAHVLPTNGQAGGVASGTEAYYAFDYANVHFIVLDSMDSSRAPSSPMLTWLQNDLASTGQEWVIAYWHHPPYSKGGHDSDNAADSGGRMIDMRETVLPILEAGGVDLVLAGHSHAYERSYLIDGAYGYGTSPTFVTPSFNTLLADGHILDAGNGNPSGNGAYQKHSGGNSHDGTVYVVAGHGGHGLSVNPQGNHPVMAVFDLAFGSVLLDVNGSSLTLRNVRSGGAINDTIAIQKSPAGSNLAPNSVIDMPSADQSILVGQSLTFTGTGTDPEPNPPLTHRWTFGAGSGVADRTVEDPGNITFNTAGVFTVTYTVTDSLGLSDPTPATVQVTVNPGGGSGGFTAYNDLAWGTGQLTTNITRITSPNGGSGLPSSGQLLNFATGNLTPVTLTVAGGSYGGGAQATQGANPTTGDAFNLFNGKVSGQGVISYVDNVNNSLVLTFSGLNPSKIYDLAFFAHRNANSWDRASLVTLSGQSGFTNTSSVATDNPDTVNYPGGVLFTGPASPSTRLPADNDNGYVARFSNIDPGSDGTVVLTISFNGNVASQYTGKYGSAIRLAESDGGGGPVNQAPNGVINTPSGAQTILVGQSLTFTGTGTDPEPNLPLTHRWTFGTGSGIPNATAEDPGSVTFNTAGVFTVTYTVTDALGLADPTPATVQITVTTASGPPPPLNRSGWVVWVDSAETVSENGQGTNAIDGNTATIWHTQWSGTVTPPHPHSLVADLGAVASISGFQQLPRQTTGSNGTIGAYEFYIKSDSASPPTLPPVLGQWTLVASGTFPNTKTLKEVLFSARDTRYVWLRALNDGQGTNIPWTSLAEFNVLGTLGGGGPVNQAPNGVINTPSGAQTILVGQSLTFTGTGTDPEPNLPLTHRWTFGTGSGIPNATAEDPGSVTFNTAGVFTVTYTVTDALGLADPTPATVQITVTTASGPPPPLNRSGWVVWVDSAETVSENGQGTNAIDGNTATIWHTQWSGTVTPPHPHSLVADLGAVASISGFQQLPRQTTGSNGTIGAYEFYIKSDSASPPTLPPVLGQWTLVASGTFPNTKTLKEVLFSARDTRYVWLRALNDGQGTNIPWTSLAEFNVLGTLGGGGPVNQAPNGVINTPSGAQTILVGQSLTFTGTGTDPEPNLPLTHRWTFGTGSGIPNATAEDPGSVTFNTAGVFTVTYTVTDALGLADPTPATVQITVTTASGPPPPLNRSGWVVWVDSAETVSENGQGTNAIDGNTATIWHTQWSGTVTPPHPHSLVADLGAVASISGFQQLPRQTTGSNGTIGAYEFYIKSDSASPPTLPPVLGQWTLVASGTFPNTKTLKEVLFSARDTRYVWLRALNDGQGTNNPWTSLAEFNVLGTLGGGG